MSARNIVIAVDGPAASGKGTLSKRLAAQYNLAYLDTGLIYRAVGRSVIDAGASPGDADAATKIAEALQPDALEKPGLRTEETGAAASKVAAVPGVRAALLDFQRRFAMKPPGGKAGAVLDGRDIGTVICPDADLKLFLMASPEVRASRRAAELRDQGEEAIDEAVLASLKARDERDSGRSEAPLLPADDAIRLDTDALNADAVFQIASELTVKIAGAADEAGRS
jgi:cytidylate kinase